MITYKCDECGTPHDSKLNLINFTPIETSEGDSTCFTFHNPQNGFGFSTGEPKHFCNGTCLARYLFASKTVVVTDLEKIDDATFYAAFASRLHMKEESHIVHHLHLTNHDH